MPALLIWVSAVCLKLWVLMPIIRACLQAPLKILEAESSRKPCNPQRKPDLTPSDQVSTSIETSLFNFERLISELMRY